MKKTKIVCTLGPSSDKEEIIEEMLKAGMNVARFNFSHGTHESQGESIDRFRKVRDRMNIPAAVMLDTKGPEIRLGKVRNGTALKDGEEFTLTSRDVVGDSKQVSVTYKDLPEKITEGTIVLIDDGLVKLKVCRIEDTDIICRVVVGGPIKDHKGVNIPHTDIQMPYISEKDRSDILFGIEKDVDYIAASFVRSRKDVEELRRLLDYHGGHGIKIISKIENEQGVNNFEGILEASDGIMVARGDMGVEIDYELLPGIQKRIIHDCVCAGKMVVCATQMLESMVVNTTPTRAEISDVANAVFDGTSAVMLSGETASGAHPALAVKVMADIARQAEKDALNLKLTKNIEYDVDRCDRTNAVCDAAVTMARDLNAKAVIAVTVSGATARNVSKFRPQQPVIAATTTEKVYHQLALSWGVVPVIALIQDNTDALFRHAIDCGKLTGLVEEGDRVVITAGVPLNTKGSTNIVKVEIVE